MNREQARAHALTLISAVASIKDTLGDGFQVTDFMGLFGALSGAAPTFQAVFTDGTVEDRILVGEEMFDALTGSDPTALEMTQDFIPGLSLEQEEQLLDFAKTMVGAQIRARTA